LPTAPLKSFPSPNILLAGERDGFRINAAQTGSIDFDFGNSPREFTAERIRNRRIAITTTNGTRALRACAHAAEIHIGSFLNLSALAKRVSVSAHQNILIICAGTADESSLEDTLAAGALCDEFSSNPQSAIGNPQLKDSAEIALAAFLHHKPNLIAAVSAARNGRRLLAIPELAPDVAICFQRDTLKITARLHPDGIIRAE
jgi:2-phosphosulfolactate phosphatase